MLPFALRSLSWGSCSVRSNPPQAPSQHGVQKRNSGTQNQNTSTRALVHPADKATHQIANLLSSWRFCRREIIICPQSSWCFWNQVGFSLSTPSLPCLCRRTSVLIFGRKMTKENCPGSVTVGFYSLWGQGRREQNVDRFFSYWMKWQLVCCLFDRSIFGELTLAGFQTKLKSEAGFWRPLIWGILCGKLKLGSEARPLQRLQFLSWVQPASLCVAPSCVPGRGLPGGRALLPSAWRLPWRPRAPGRREALAASPGLPRDKGRFPK